MTSPNASLRWTWNCDGVISAVDGKQHIEIGEMYSADDAERVCELHNGSLGLCTACGGPALMAVGDVRYCPSCTKAAIDKGEIKP